MARLGWAWRGSAWHGEARLGPVGCGMARQGEAWIPALISGSGGALRGVAGRGLVGCGVAWLRLVFSASV